jgi:hypothetical protein
MVPKAAVRVPHIFRRNTLRSSLRLPPGSRSLISDVGDSDVAYLATGMVARGPLIGLTTERDIPHLMPSRYGPSVSLNST